MSYGPLMAWRAMLLRDELAKNAREVWRLRDKARAEGRNTDADFQHFKLRCLLNEAGWL